MRISPTYELRSCSRDAHLYLVHENFFPLFSFFLIFKRDFVHPKQSPIQTISDCGALEMKSSACSASSNQRVAGEKKNCKQKLLNVLNRRWSVCVRGAHMPEMVKLKRKAIEKACWRTKPTQIANKIDAKISCFAQLFLLITF